jgi:hypothetical protein
VSTCTSTQLSRGQVKRAIGQLEAQGRVHEITDRHDRFRAIADEYVKNPEGTLVVSPDNRSRIELRRVFERGIVDDRGVATVLELTEDLANERRFTRPPSLP